MTSSIWSDSVGARAYVFLRAKPQGAIVGSSELAASLGVGVRALHTLLANAIKLHLLEKTFVEGWKCMGWKIGPARAPRIEHRVAPPSERGTGKRRNRTPRETSVMPFRSIQWPAGHWMFEVAPRKRSTGRKIHPSTTVTEPAITRFKLLLTTTPRPLPAGSRFGGQFLFRVDGAIARIVNEKEAAFDLAAVGEGMHVAEVFALDVNGRPIFDQASLSFVTHGGRGTPPAGVLTYPAPTSMEIVFE